MRAQPFTFAYFRLIAALGVALSTTPLAAQVLVLDDPLLGSALGTVGGGTFLADGWRVNGQYDSIYWHIPTVSQGAAEWSIRGLFPNESRPAMNDKSELFHMYDYTYDNADVNYFGYRNNPYKHFVRKIGSNGGATNALELLWQISPNYEEPDTAVLSWNPGTTYRFREEWGPDGSGNSVLRTYRGGVLLRTTTVPGTWNPTGHSVRIGAANPPGTRSAPIDAVFSNLQVWDLSVSDPLPPLPAPRTGDVALSGHALTDAGGEFTGLGASYFQALRRTKYDRAEYRSDLDFLARNGFDYIRTLSMVGGNSAWTGKEIAPITFQNDKGQTVQGWNDYWQQFRDMIDIAYDEFGIRTQITIFADAQFGMPNEADRIAHMQNVLNNIQGREHKVMLLEVANEYWQNGFPDPGGVAKVREFGQYLADRTDRLVALSSTNATNATLQQMYQGSAADIATEHFTRDRGTVEGGWLPVRDPWRVNSAVGIPPVISNEPIGPGSSVSSENDPIKLVSAAAFAWMAGLPAYVFHSNAGVLGNTRFQDMAGVTNFRQVQDILPGDIGNWQRSDGQDALSPFTSYANGQANKWWTEVSSPTSGAVRNIANVKGNDFYSLPIGILGGGVELQARKDMTIQVFNPLNGQVVLESTPSAAQRFTLVEGPEAYIIRGSYADGGPARINLDAVNDPHGLVHPQGGDGDTVAATIGGRNARRNANPNEDFYMYFAAADWFTHQGNQPELYITVDYFDQGNGSLTLQYDSNTGNTLPAFYKNTGSIPLGGTDTWKQHTFHISDAYFGNRQNQGADFRMFGGVGNPFYLDQVQVSKPPVLLLSVNPYSGELTIQNPSTTTALSLDGYQITSASGSLVPDPTHAFGVGWDSLANAGLTGWEEVSPTANALSELNLSSSISIPAAGSITLGKGFATAGTQDLLWGNSAPGAATNPATIQYAGGLQVQVINLLGGAPGNAVEATTAVLLNQESSQSFNFDAYVISSPSGSLDPAGFSGLAGHAVAGWESVALSANALSELNLSGSTTLAPGAGQILGSPFTTGAAKDLTLQFHLVGPGTQTLNGTVLYKDQLAGDVNNDHVVNIFDINLISSNWATSGPAGDGNYDGTVNIFDINFVSSHWANTLGGGGGAMVVPEPGGLLLLVIGLLTVSGHVLHRRGPANGGGDGPNRTMIYRTFGSDVDSGLKIDQATNYVVIVTRDGSGNMTFDLVSAYSAQSAVGVVGNSEIALELGRIGNLVDGNQSNSEFNEHAFAGYIGRILVYDEPLGADARAALIQSLNSYLAVPESSSILLATLGVLSLAVYAWRPPGAGQTKLAFRVD